MKCVEAAHFEIEKILNDHTADFAKKQKNDQADDLPAVIPNVSVIKSHFPPGYSDNFSKRNQQLSNYNLAIK